MISNVLCRFCLHYQNYHSNLTYWFPPILGGNVCNQRCLSVILSFCLSFCHSVRNADISETIIARAAKFGMHNLHIKSAKFVEGNFQKIRSFSRYRIVKIFRELVIIFGESELISAKLTPLLLETRHTFRNTKLAELTFCEKFIDWIVWRHGSMWFHGKTWFPDVVPSVTIFFAGE